MSYLQRSVNGVTIDNSRDDRLSALFDALSYQLEPGERVNYVVTHDDGPGFEAIGLTAGIALYLEPGYIKAMCDEQEDLRS